MSTGDGSSEESKLRGISNMIEHGSAALRLRVDLVHRSGVGSIRAIVLMVAAALIVALAIFIGIKRTTPEAPSAFLDRMPPPYVTKPVDGGACVCARGDPLCDCL